jgi:CBS-domain-containing membrane protein
MQIAETGNRPQGTAAKLKDSLIALTRDALGSLRDLLPIIIVISVFQIFVFREPVDNLISSPVLHSSFLVCASPCSPLAKAWRMRLHVRAASSG